VHVQVALEVLDAAVGDVARGRVDALGARGE
jgi:hypothetical protein